MFLENRVKISCLTVLIVLNFLVGLNYVKAGRYIPYPDYRIKEISNFKMCCQEIFQIIGIKMGIKINDAIPQPTILTDDQLTLQQFRSYLGWDAPQIFPYYFHKNNLLVIPRSCKLDILAHEFVHYFQVMYRNENFDFDCGLYLEILEIESLTIQRWFKAKFMRPRLPQ